MFSPVAEVAIHYMEGAHRIRCGELAITHHAPLSAHIL
jgi:hypothetical protein